MQNCEENLEEIAQNANVNSNFFGLNEKYSAATIKEILALAL